MSILKALYKIVPFKQQLFSCIRFFFTPSEALYKHLHFKGVFTVTTLTGSKFKLQHYGNIVENEIYWSGLYKGWEKKSMFLWSQLCKDSEVILDIGANTGIYALVAKSIAPAAKVLAFEPIPLVYRQLKHNVDINKYDVSCYEMGLSDYDGTAKIYLQAGHEFAYSVTLNENTLGNKQATEHEVAVYKLATIIKEQNIPRIDLMKIDVETHEAMVMKGMEDYLKAYRPTILIEVLNNEIAEKLNTVFEGLGYVYYNIDDNNGNVRRTERIMQSDYFNYLICSPDIANKLGL